MSIRSIVLALVLATLGFRSAVAEEGVAGPQLLTDKAYGPRVSALIDAAQTSIDVVMYQVNLPVDARPTHPVRVLLDRLVARHQAGVAVSLVVDAGTPEEGVERPSANAAAYLASKGIDVRWDEDDRTTHDKALVVDGRWCVIGSTNWTAAALGHNRELSVLLDDRELAAKLAKLFAAIREKSHPVE